jgi:hypothetical protein
VEGKLGKNYADLWNWKHSKVPTDLVDPHPFPLRDLSDLKSWKGRNASAQGQVAVDVKSSVSNGTVLTSIETSSGAVRDLVHVSGQIDSSPPGCLRHSRKS